MNGQDQLPPVNRPNRYILLLVLIAVIIMAVVGVLLTTSPTAEQPEPTNTPDLTYVPLGVNLISLAVEDDAPCRQQFIVIVPEHPVTGQLCVENETGKTCSETIEIGIGRWTLATTLTEGQANTVTFEGDFRHTPLTGLTCAEAD